MLSMLAMQGLTLPCIANFTVINVEPSYAFKLFY